MWQLELRESLLCSWSMGFRSFGIRGAISCGNFPKNTGIVHYVSSDSQTYCDHYIYMTRKSGFIHEVLFGRGCVLTLKQFFFRRKQADFLSP